MTQLSGEPFIEVTRGRIVESLHNVAACAINKAGEVVLAMGEIDTPVFLRSAAKPFIAATAVKYGAVSRFDLEPREIALMAASHSGEPFHVEGVRSILKKIGLPESALQCGVHAPYNAVAAAELERSGQPLRAVYNNCSGKHAGILALCLLLGSDADTYMELGNPAEQEILKFCARMTDDDAQNYELGVDGCGIPVFATSLRRAATAFMRFATLVDTDPGDAAALQIVRDAMNAYPAYVSGTGEFDAALMDAAGGTIACKAGAEGVHGDAMIEAQAGFALKVIDGAKRAVAPAVLALLHEAGLISADLIAELERFARPELQNRAGRHVGEIRARRAILAKPRTL